MYQYTPLTLRPATVEDYDAVFSLFSEVQNLHARALPQVFKPSKKDQPNQSFRALFNKSLESSNKHLIIGFAEQQPVGYILFETHAGKRSGSQKPQPFIYITHIVVTETQRGKGYGSIFIQYVKETAKKHNIQRIGLEVWVFNEAAKKFFESQGFTGLREIMWHQSDNEYRGDF